MLLDLKRRGMETGPELSVPIAPSRSSHGLLEGATRGLRQQTRVHGGSTTPDVLNQMRQIPAAKATGPVMLHDIWMAETRPMPSHLRLLVKPTVAKPKAAERLIKEP